MRGFAQKASKVVYVVLIICAGAISAQKVSAAQKVIPLVEKFDMVRAMSKNPTDTPPKQSLAHRSDGTPTLRAEAGLAPNSADAGPVEPRGWIKSYLLYWKLAWKELEQIKGYRWMKVGGKLINTVLAFTGLAALSIGLWLWPLLPPLAWLSVVLGIMFLVAQFTIYLFGRYHERTVAGLEERRRAEIEGQRAEHAKELEAITTQLNEHFYREVLPEEVSKLRTLTAERDSLKSQLEERDRYKLFLVVEFNPIANPHDPWELLRSEVRFDDDAQMFDFEPDRIVVEGILPGKSIITADLIIKFENRGKDKTIIRTVWVSLMRKTTRGREVEFSHRAVRAMPIETSPITGAPHTLDSLSVEGLTIIEPMRVRCIFEMSGRIGHRLNQDCFIRVSMDAMNQQLFPVDLDLDWEKARNTDGPVPVTPRK